MNQVFGNAAVIDLLTGHATTGYTHGDAYEALGLYDEAYDDDSTHPFASGYITNRGNFSDGSKEIVKIPKKCWV